MSKKVVMGADGRLYQVLAAGVVLAGIVSTSTSASAALPKQSLPNITFQDDEISSTLSTVPY